MKEIAKCDVVCMNCHVTYAPQNDAGEVMIKMAGSNTGGVGFSQMYYQPVAPVTPGAIVGNMPPQPWVRSVLDGG